MRKFVKKILSLSKREQFVIFVITLSIGLFISEFTFGLEFILLAIILALITDIFLFLALKNDIKGNFNLPIFILPFLYTLAFALFYSLIPARLISRVLLTGIYGFGLYSLFLTQNIFAVSSIRTITLLRSARIVSFILTLVAFFFLSNVAFSSRPPFFLLPLFIAVISFLLSYESQWSYNLDKKFVSESLIASVLIAISMFELSIVLLLWPINAAIYSIFLTGIFYTYSGLLHAWVERRLFKGVLVEYVWVGFLSTLLLILFSNWGI